MSTDPGETKEFDFLGSRCDHEALKRLEPKKHSKSAEIIKKCQFLRGFWVLAVLNLDGRIPNPGNGILWVLPDL